MANWDDLNEDEKKAAKKFIDHYRGNSQRGSYPATADGVKNYLNDNAVPLAVGGAATGTASFYTQKALKYLETAVKAVK